jgi:hypothetical protein
MDAFEQMRLETPRQILAANSGHESLAVESTSHGGLEAKDLGWVLGVGKALRQLAKFIRAQLPSAGEPHRIVNHLGLFVRRQVVNFFNHFGSGHGFRLAGAERVGKMQDLQHVLLALAGMQSSASAFSLF